MSTLVIPMASLVYFAGFVLTSAAITGYEAYVSAFNGRKFTSDLFPHFFYSIVWPMTVPSLLSYLLFKHIGHRRCLAAEQRERDLAAIDRQLSEAGIHYKNR